MPTPIELIFALFILVASAWVCVGLSYRFWMRHRNGPHFPSRASVNILFEERWTSGRSLKSWRTRMMGGSSCLWVTVTDDEIWIRPHFPFTALASDGDYDHRVHSDQLRAIARTDIGIRVDYVTRDYEGRAVELFLRHSDEFLHTVRRIVATRDNDGAERSDSVESLPPKQTALSDKLAIGKWARWLLLSGFIVIPLMTLFQWYIMFFGDARILSPEDRAFLEQASWLEKVGGPLLFLIFWGGINTVFYTMLIRRRKRPRRSQVDKQGNPSN